MKLYRTQDGIVIENENQFYLLENKDWDSFVNDDLLFQKMKEKIKDLSPSQNNLAENVLAPVGSKQELWACGVTYLRSKIGRQEESKDAGGGDFYAKVYEADRPELFFKATAYRTVGPGDVVRIRKDSQWNVPEPELTLFICSQGTIEGYTVGNDMSSRDIEGENPLYLPQAKSYNASAAIGPCLYVSEAPIHPDSLIRLEIQRQAELIFSGEISINRMKRKHEELVEYLFRETSFPNGVYLMTGTGIVPPDHFTLKPGDEIKVSIENIGILVNTVGQ